jgi:cell pole-organizing protein PopZ
LPADAGLVDRKRHRIFAKEYVVTQWVEKLMNDARTAVAQDQDTYLSRIRRKIFWKGRKELIHSPRTLGHVAAAHVPVVGAAAAFLYDQVVQKAVKARQDWRRTKAATNAGLQPTVDALIRERSKEDAKSLIDVVTHIDGNQPKLRYATDALMSAFNDYNSDTDSSDYSNIVANAQKLAAEIYNCEHYEVKLQALIEVARRYLDEIEIHIENSRNTTIDIEQALIDDLENYNRELAPNAQHEVMGMVENQQFTFDDGTARL